MKSPERKRRRTPQRERAELTRQLMENMQRIVHNSDRANQIVSDMTAIGRQGNRVFSKTDVNLLLANQINWAWQAAKAQEPEFSVEIQRYMGLAKIRLHALLQMLVSLAEMTANFALPVQLRMFA